MIALTHVPSPALGDGQRTYVARAALDHDLAARQHAEYCALLRRCGADVCTLDVNRDLPDAVFIEDTAVVLDEFAVLTSMGTKARRAELVGIEPELRKYREVRRLQAPDKLEGGDVLRVGRTLLVGRSCRTDAAGVAALEAIARPLGYAVTPVPVRSCLHLKTACTALPDGRLLVNADWIDGQALRGFELVPVPAEEPWAANVLAVGGRVCMAAGHGRTTELLRGLGFEVEAVDLSEFAKAEGGVTCLSVLIDTTVSAAPDRL